MSNFSKSLYPSINQNDKGGSRHSQAKRLCSVNLSQLPIAGLVLFLTGFGLDLRSHAFANPVAETGEVLLGAAISKTVSGRRIYLGVPLGGEFPLFYQKDGRVDGSGEAVGLGKFLSPTDSGKWWVENNKLCQQWTQWYEGKVFCFKLEKLPDDKIIWRRDDGYEGIARIGD